MTTPRQGGGDSYGVEVGGGVGENVVVGSHNTLHTTIYRAPVVRSPVVGPVRRMLPRPERVVGRDTLLVDLRSRLAVGRGVRVVALCGLGGVGKTTTAIEYSHQHLDGYELVWHLHAETVTGLLADFNGLAEALGVEVGGDVVGAVHTALAARSGSWLLVLDNVIDHAVIRRFLPTAGTGHVVVTTQDGTWPKDQCLDVPTLGLDAAVGFLLDAAATTDRQDAARLAEALGLLPLALVQAAAYLRNTGLTLAEYLDHLDRQPVDMLDRGAPPGHPDPVTGTWRIATADLERTSPGSVTLLRLLAFTGPEDIPFRLLLDHPTPLPTTINGEVAAAVAVVRAGGLAVPDAMAGLRRFSLVGPPTHTVSVHRLVQAITRHHLTAVQQEQWRQATAGLITAAIPAEVEVREAWPVCRLLLPHALAACDLTSPAMWDLARYLGWAGDYATARTVWATLHDAHTHHPDYGPEHPDTLTTRDNLARWTGEAGDAAGARDQFQALLPVRERASGPEHPDTLTTRHNLAWWTGKAGDEAGARDQYQPLLLVREQVLGPEHPSTLITRNNLAWWTGRAGDAAGARDQFRALLPVRERVLGPEHRDTLITRSNLAWWTGEAGDAVGARDQFRALLPVRERVLGPEHPGTLIVRNNLAWWTGMAGDAVGARDQFQALLPVWERVSGPEHPDTLITRNNLALWTRRAKV